MCAYMYVGVPMRLRISVRCLLHCLPCLLRVSLNLELRDPSKLADQWAPGIRFSLLSFLLLKLWLSTHTQLTYLYGGDLNSGLQTSISPALIIFQLVLPTSYWFAGGLNEFKKLQLSSPNLFYFSSVTTFWINFFILN